VIQVESDSSIREIDSSSEKEDENNEFIFDEE
jgi:hypothetical protein